MATLQLSQVASNNDNGNIILGMPDMENQLEEPRRCALEKLVRVLLWVGFLTLVMAVGTALYKPPRGAIFERHQTAYYLTLAAIFTAGIAEVWTAMWLSSSGEDNGRRRGCARAALYVSVVPFVAIIALGGFAILMKG